MSETSEGVNPLEAVGPQPIMTYPSETVDKVISPTDIFEGIATWIHERYWGLINSWQTTNFYRLEDIEEKHFRARANSASLLNPNLTEFERLQINNAEDLVDAGLTKSLDGQTAKRILPNLGMHEGQEKKKKWGIF